MVGAAVGTNVGVPVGLEVGAGVGPSTVPVYLTTVYVYHQKTLTTSRCACANYWIGSHLNNSI